MNKKLTMALTAVISASLPQAALAEGSSWGSLQNSPVEDNNVIGTLYGEKSWPVWQGSGGLKASPFISGTLVHDEDGNFWNNKVTLRAGGKLSYPAGPATFTLRAGAAHEHLYKSGDSYSAPFVSAEYWVGWGFGTSMPGSSWGVVGNISPSEKGNTIGMLYGKQGFLAFNAGKGRVTPFVDGTFARDSKGYDWNNKEVYGLGVEYVHPFGDGSFSVGIKHQEERRKTSRGSGAVLSLTYWVPLK